MSRIFSKNKWALGAVIAMAMMGSVQAKDQKAAASAAPAEEKVATASKLDTKLVEAVRSVQEQKENARPLSRLSTSGVRIDKRGRIQTIIAVTCTCDDTQNRLKKEGARIEHVLEKEMMIQAWIPWDKLDAISGFDFVKSIKAPDYARTRSR